jgi:formylmethanofuran dehydrogenase subunit C
MSTLRLDWRSRPPGLLDAAPLRPDLLCALDERAIGRTPLLCGSEFVELGDLFTLRSSPRVEGAAGPGPTLVVPGSPRYLRLAAGMTSGALEVEGDAGEWALAGLQGGEVRVSGSVGHGAAAGISGGLVRIDGAAGDRLGGLMPGFQYGMSGGEIRVRGRAGALVGERQRRGLIAIGSGIGPQPGLGMLAGTIVAVEGDLVDPGLGMKRGTIIGLASRVAPPLGFGFDGRVTPIFWRLIARRLSELGLDLAPADSNGRSFLAYSGDPMTLGRGEVLFAS